MHLTKERSKVLYLFWNLGGRKGISYTGFAPQRNPICHHLDKNIPEDLAFTWTDAAQSVLHDSGMVLSSDSQAMSCVEEIVTQTWHTVSKMKTCMGLLVTHQCVVMGEWRGIMPRIRWVREHFSRPAQSKDPSIDR